MRQQPKPPLDLFGVQSATDRARQYAESSLCKALRYNADSEREERLKAHQCPWCWYFRRPVIAGQAFTEWTCSGCGAEAQHANTATPRLCVACAEKYGLCVQCTGDIEMRPRKKLERK